MPRTPVPVRDAAHQVRTRAGDVFDAGHDLLHAPRVRASAPWVAGGLGAAAILILLASRAVDGRVDGLLVAALPVVGVVLARIADVTLNVLRTVFVVSGRRTAAGLVAAAETGVWLAAAAVVLDDLTLVKGVAYCVGVGIGTIAGMALVRAAKWGIATVRAFVPEGQGDEVAELLRSRGIGATVFTGRGRDGGRDMVLSLARRREAAAVAQLLAGREDTLLLVDSEAVIGTVAGSTGRV